ncbi:MAG: protein-L-isoaspartate(D-aspartate) O-methyltransferase [Candidatus Zixiibacteriota bacterium]|nr:MAG: protein-L-isoaspartate(D-aspartate) O-methyltransferase [candidate division Zixibacteria bacterium]
MVSRQIERRGVSDPNVLAAMRTVPRHLFVPDRFQHEAYTDGPLPIGHGQTISQPYIVASMTEELRCSPGDKVLEIGTGSGYQTAVLAECGFEVYSIELIADLQEAAKERLRELGYTNIHFKLGDGSLGWPEAAPFNGILVAAAAQEIPRALIEQLADGGRLVIPIQDTDYTGQKLYVVTRHGQQLVKQYLYDVRFVPLLHDGDVRGDAQ